MLLCNRYCLDSSELVRGTEIQHEKLWLMLLAKLDDEK
jgi:hypothetical protein